MTEKKVIYYESLDKDEINILKKIASKRKGITSMADATGLSRVAIRNAMAGLKIQRDTAKYIRENVLKSYVEPA